MIDLQQDVIYPVTGGSVRLSITSEFTKEIASTHFPPLHVEPQYEPPIQTEAPSQNKPLNLKLKSVKLKVKKFVVWCWIIIAPPKREPNAQLPRSQPLVEGEVEPQYERPIEVEASRPKTRTQKWKRGLVTFGYFLWDCLVCLLGAGVMRNHFVGVIRLRFLVKGMQGYAIF